MTSPAEGWRMAACLLAGEKERLEVVARLLAAEFAGYHFGTAETRDHIAIAAVRRGSPSAPGVYAVITRDVAEMRRALLDGNPPPGG